MLMLVRLGMLENASSSSRICSMHPFITEVPPSYNPVPKLCPHLNTLSQLSHLLQLSSHSQAMSVSNTQDRTGLSISCMFYASLSFVWLVL